MTAVAGKLLHEVQPSLHRSLIELLDEALLTILLPKEVQG